MGRTVAVHSVTKMAEMDQVKINLFAASCRSCHETGLDFGKKPPISHRMDSYGRTSLFGDRPSGESYLQP